MKKIAFMFVAAAMFAACGGSKTEAPVEEAQEVVEQVAEEAQEVVEQVADSAAEVVEEAQEVVEEAAAE